MPFIKSMIILLTGQRRKTKAEVITLLDTPGNSAKTWVWNYDQSKWNIGENVQVVNMAICKYLRSNPDKQTTYNLAPLIDFDWIFP